MEFGPPSRWTAVTGQSAADAVSVMTKIRKHGYHVRVVRSLAWDAARKMISDPTIQKATRFGVEYMELVNEAHDEQLVRAMVTCNCESYLWFVRTNLTRDDIMRDENVTVSSRSAPAFRQNSMTRRRRRREQDGSRLARQRYLTAAFEAADVNRDGVLQVAEARTFLRLARTHALAI